MTEPFLDEEDVFRLVVFHSRSKVSQRGEVDSVDSGVPQFCRNFPPLCYEVLPELVQQSVPKHPLRRLRQLVEHRNQFARNLDLPRHALLLEVVDVLVLLDSMRRSEEESRRARRWIEFLTIIIFIIALAEISSTLATWYFPKQQALNAVLFTVLLPLMAGIIVCVFLVFRRWKSEKNMTQKRKEESKMLKVSQLLFLTRKKDSRAGYLLTFVISWIALATLLTLSGNAGPTIPYMKNWPIWFVWIIDIALVCWPIPLILDIPFAFGFVSSWLLFWLVATPSDLIRDWLQLCVGVWIVTPWPDIAIECLLVVFICLIFLPIQHSCNRLVEKILRARKS